MGNVSGTRVRHVTGVLCQAAPVPPQSSPGLKSRTGRQGRARLEGQWEETEMENKIGSTEGKPFKDARLNTGFFAKEQ